MSRCYYHPLAPATWQCEHCETPLCDHCADDSPSRGGPRCFQCQTPLESLGAAHTAEPFWRRLNEAFRYPLNSNALVTIGLCSLGSATAPYLPLGFLIYLLVIGAMLRYGFTCMKASASGRTEAPNSNEGSGGGLTILAQLFAVTLLLGFAIGSAYHYIGPGTGGFLATLAWLGFPAIVILFADRGNMLEAINPLNIVQLVLALGLSYGVLLGMIMVMMASVEVLHSLFSGLGFVGLLIQNAITWFYLVVTFHIMGWMIFQHQGALGFVARADDQPHQRNPKARHRSKIDIAVKRGEYNKAVDLYVEANSLFPQDIQFYQQCFSLLCGARLTVRLEKFFPHFIHQLEKHGYDLEIYPAYKRLRQLIPNYQPDSPQLRQLLGSACLQNGDPKTALQLLLPLPKLAPQFARLEDTYRAIAQALAGLGKEAESQKALALAEKHVRKAAPAPAAETKRRGRMPPKTLKVGNQVENAPLAPESEKNQEGKADGNGDLPPIDFKL